MKEQAFLSYRLNVSNFDENADTFSDLPIEDQKNFLIEVLDKNQLYVNYSEIEDSEFDVNDDLKHSNRVFYGDL